MLTAWIVGHTDRFAAASANCPVINWISFVGTTDGASWYYNFEKLPWEDPSEHLAPLAAHVRRQREDADDADDGRERSAHADAADRGVLQALKLRKVPTAMIRFNDEWHGTTIEAVELPAHAALPALLVRQVQARRRTEDHGAVVREDR